MTKFLSKWHNYLYAMRYNKQLFNSIYAHITIGDVLSIFIRLTMAHFD